MPSVEIAVDIHIRLLAHMVPLKKQPYPPLRAIVAVLIVVQVAAFVPVPSLQGTGEQVDVDAYQWQPFLLAVPRDKQLAAFVQLPWLQGIGVPPVAHVPAHPVHVPAEQVRVLHAVVEDQPQPVLGSMAPIAPQKAALVVLPSEHGVLLVGAEHGLFCTTNVVYGSKQAVPR